MPPTKGSTTRFIGSDTPLVRSHRTCTHVSTHTHTHGKTQLRQRRSSNRTASERQPPRNQPTNHHIQPTNTSRPPTRITTPTHHAGSVRLEVWEDFLQHLVLLHLVGAVGLEARQPLRENRLTDLQRQRQRQQKQQQQQEKARKQQQQQQRSSNNNDNDNNTTTSNDKNNKNNNKRMQNAARKTRRTMRQASNGCTHFQRRCWSATQAHAHTQAQAYQRTHTRIPSLHNACSGDTQARLRLGSVPKHSDLKD
jgi:hypothetical protein